MTAWTRLTNYSGVNSRLPRTSLDGMNEPARRIEGKKAEGRIEAFVSDDTAVVTYEFIVSLGLAALERAGNSFIPRNLGRESNP